MSRDTLKRVRDAIHGLIHLQPAEWDVVDTPVFQRLRGVQQLAMTHLVYPGARHSRFEHSIGCCEVAGRVAAQLQLPSNESRLVRFAALLHDVGHGPFSHVSDEVFRAFIESSRDASKVHEHISAAVALHDPRVRDALGDDAEPVADLLAQRGAHRSRTLTRDIVSGPADIDKLDYLLRDSHYCGVNYGRYDLEKLTKSVVAIEDGRETYLGYRESAVYALEEMLLARYHMHRQVYGHKTRIACDLALTRTMIIAVQGGLLPRDVFAPPVDPDEDFIAEYSRWTDSEVVHRLLRANGDHLAKMMMQALIDRRLPKRMVKLTGDQLKGLLDGPTLRWLASPSGFGATGPEPIERKLSDSLGVPAHAIFFHDDRLGDPVSRPHGYGVDEKDVPIRMDDGKRTTLHSVSQVFDTRPPGERLVVSLFYWPLDGEQQHSIAEQANVALYAALEATASDGV